MAEKPRQAWISSLLCNKKPAPDFRGGLFYFGIAGLL